MSDLRLSPHDLASAVVGDLDGISKAGRTVIGAILREDPRLTEQLAELEAMARDAGVDNVLDGLETRRRFDILLSEEWEHPSDVLDEDPEDVWYEPLLHLATTLTDRAEDAAKTLAIERRLETAYAVYRTGEEIFESIAERLDQLAPETAERTLQRLAHHLQRRRESAEPAPAVDAKE